MKFMSPTARCDRDRLSTAARDVQGKTIVGTLPCSLAVPDAFTGFVNPVSVVAVSGVHGLIYVADAATHTIHALNPSEGQIAVAVCSRQACLAGAASAYRAGLE